MLQKKLQNLNDNFDPNIYRSLNIFVSQKLQIFSAFQRGALYKCSWSIQETSVILVKLVRNWNMYPNFLNYAIVKSYAWTILHYTVFCRRKCSFQQLSNRTDLRTFPLAAISSKHYHNNRKYIVKYIDSTCIWYLYRIH